MYAPHLNGDGSTFDLTPVVSSDAAGKNRATNARAPTNITDADSEAVSPDGSTLIVDLSARPQHG